MRAPPFHRRDFEDAMTDAITPFKISIPDAQLVDLKRRLQATRWPDKETPGDWSQGIPLAYVQDVCRYWASDYDWRKREASLNRFPQFKTTIDGVDIHFVHVRSPHANALPLVMTHGWPGSIVEFHKVIEPLTDPTKHGGNAADAFHVVCPSLPGYAFSGKPTSPGWNVEKIGRAWSQLMPRLGYPKFVAQGGDWGAIVTTAIGLNDTQNCLGIHLNMPIVTPDPATMNDLTEREKSALAGMQHYADWDSGYSKQQSTRPQTLGYGLADSPSGQAAWIIEKFWSWMDCNGHPENVLTRDELLDNVMLYWLTNSAASSARLYWESFNKVARDPVKVPTGCSIFPKEIFRCSKRWAEKRFEKLVHWNDLDKGGHFAAFEVPETFVNEVRTCFRHMR
jgi:pimeloyl-ACP methyl ester carboxylesterase